jgi:predicted acyltransferase
MCTLALSGLSLATTAKRLGYGPEAETDSLAGWFWQTLAFHTSHPPWNSQFHFVGVSYWDLIQPAFMFMVGVAMPYSYAKRQRQGDPATRRALHALIRALVLILLGVFLQTRSSGLETNRLLTNVLAQIGLGYFFVYSVMSLSARMQIALGAAVLVLYNAWMLAWPAPETLGATAAESIADLTVPESVARHFALGVNAAAEADVRLLRFLTGSDSIDAHRGGYATLNFIPSAVTILLGVLAGNLLRSTHSASVKVRRLFVGGAICMALAVVASFTGCPVVKRLWTPSWTLYSGAYVLWALALLYWVIDVRHWRRWTFPLVVVGTNSLAMYLMSMLWKGWIATRFEVYLGSDVFSGLYGATLQSLCVFAVLWLICLYLYRNKLFFRI